MVVSIGMHNKAIDYLNQFRKFSIVMTVYYDLIIDPITYLPYQLIEKNSVDKAGKIVYAGSFEKEKIDSLIKSNL
jgi:putative cell wall-binding protein